jgi:hypothetical protein
MSFAKRRLDDALCEQYPEPPEGPVKHYVLLVQYNTPSLQGPWPDRAERDAEAKRISNGSNFTEGEDHISWLDQAPDGTLNVGIYTDEDLELA